MKVVLQRVTHAQVMVEEQVVGKIGHGFLLLLGVEDADTVETADRMVEKICKLRIFQDEHGKTNLSLADVGGELLVVSQFTLYADCKKGNRPSFVKAGNRSMPMHFTSILWKKAVNMCRRSNMAASVRICRWNWGMKGHLHWY